MNEGRANCFDAENARALCEASARAYEEGGTPFGDIRVSSPATDTHARITRDGMDAIVAFRGTADLRNWITDLDCGFDREEGMECSPGCRIHRGFARAVDSVEERLSAEVWDLLRAGARVWLTGHSLGGALAMLFAWRFFNAHHVPPFEGIYTFGQPRVGDGAFRATYNLAPELGGATFRVVHGDDIVPRVPWLLARYRHAGHEVFYPTLTQGRKDAMAQGLIDPSLAAKLPYDIRNGWRELTRGKVALLADHHVETYREILGGDAMEGGMESRKLNSMERR